MSNMVPSFGLLYAVFCLMQRHLKQKGKIDWIQSERIVDGE